jgi:peptidoglycan hydrolase CwlO-like protein
VIFHLLTAALVILAAAAIDRRQHRREHRIMSAIDDLKTGEQDLETKVEALLVHAAQQTANTAALQAQLAAAGDVAPAVQAVVDKMRAESERIAAFLAPPATPAQPTAAEQEATLRATPTAPAGS